MMARVFTLEINPDNSEVISDELNTVFTKRGSGVGAGNPIAFSMLFSRSHRLVARDNATTLPTGVSIDPYINYFRNRTFLAYLENLRQVKKTLHEVHVDDALGQVIASSYRFKDWLITIKNYDADGVSRQGHISTVNTLVVLSPLRHLSIDSLEQEIDELDQACAQALLKYQNSTKVPKA